MAISAKAKEMTRRIYSAYGSESGILFGIPAGLKDAVECVVQVTLDMTTDKEEVSNESFNAR